MQPIFSSAEMLTYNATVVLTYIQTLKLRLKQNYRAIRS